MNVDKALKATPLLSGKLSERREEIKENLIRLTLSEYNEGDEISPNDIRIKLKSNHNIEIENTTIESILHDLQPGYVKNRQGNIYNVIGPENFEPLELRINSLWPEYKKILSGHISGMDPYIKRRFRNASEDFFSEYLVYIASSVENLNTEQREVIKDDKNYIKDLCNQAASDNQVTEKNIFRNSIKQYLEEPGDELLILVESCYTTAINIDLISREDDLISFPELPERNRIILLDTNIIVALLATTDQDHNLARIVCKKSVESGFKLRYTERTATELEELIKGCEREMSGLHEGDDKISLANNQFVEDFAGQPDREWGDYIGYLKSWRSIVETKHDVLPLQDEREPDTEVEKAARDLFLEENNHDVSAGKLANIGTDSKNLGVMVAYRKHSSWDFGPFLLSFHNNLTKIGNRLAQSDEFERSVGKRPIALQPRSLLNYLMAFSSSEVNTADQQEIVKSIIQISASFTDEITVDDYMHTLAPKIGVKNEDEEYLKRILVNHPTLSDDFEDAVEEDQGHKAEQIARNILTDTEYLQSIEDEKEYTETMKRASSRIQDLQDQLRDLKRQNLSGEEETLARYERLVETYDPIIKELARDTEYSDRPTHDRDIEEIKAWIQTILLRIRQSEKDYEDLDVLKRGLEGVFADLVNTGND